MYVITGGGSGLGRALAEELATAGEQVFLVGRRVDCLRAVAETSPLIDFIAADVSTSAGRAAVVETIEGRLNGQMLQGILHNAGVIEPIAPLETVSIEAWAQVQEVNVMAPLCLTQSLLPLLKGARVLFVGSGAAHFAVTGWSAYCVSKAALSMLTKCFQQEIQDPAFACVMPGIVDTPMTAVIRSSTAMDPKALAFHQSLQQTKHLLLPETVAMFFSWLLKTVDVKRFVSQEWDIYDTTHHAEWLCSPHVVPPLS